ncbi:MAG: T9SS type A sorting domain-containing protein [Bacteroidales bacterium]|nr:T9SS type A sorting domain-containing protein [Bacteroidales bacterium]
MKKLFIFLLFLIFFQGIENYGQNAFVYTTPGGYEKYVCEDHLEIAVTFGISNWNTGCSSPSIRLKIWRNDNLQYNQVFSASQKTLSFTFYNSGAYDFKCEANWTCDEYPYYDIDEDYLGIHLNSDCTPPSAPTNLHVTNVDKTSIALEWNESTDNEGVTGYKIYRTGDILVKDSPGTGTTTTVTGLTPCTAYSFYVKAYDARDNISNSSNIVNITTEAQDDELTYDYTITDNVFVKNANDAIHLLAGFHYTAINSSSLCNLIIGCVSQSKSSIIEYVGNDDPIIEPYEEKQLTNNPDMSITDANLVIYPNPNNGSFTISGLSGNRFARIEITNLVGKLIYSKEFCSEIEIIDISNQPNGIYLVKIVSGNQVDTKQIIKQ